MIPERVAATPMVDAGSRGITAGAAGPRYAGHHPIWAFWWRTAPYALSPCYLSIKGIADHHFYQERMPYAMGREYDCDTGHGCCFVIRTDFFESIGYFDEHTFLLRRGDDTDTTDKG